VSKKKLSASGIVYSTDPDFRIEEGLPAPAESPGPNQQRLKVRLDTRQRAGKAVTLIEGYTGGKEELEDLGKRLKTHCGTGGSVKEGQIIIQGDQRDKIMLWLLKNGYASSKKI
jgi:translation initiation factor 1